ncbi:23S rRNA (adenine(1618)-N(6))-methyltransferase RlmF [Chimaeribacter arupi]|uniref:Ribosomal RNA large subunit methyltransferase F n=1 Tax=Nissabacter archeti TaxID=1917880 RepID=A0ABS5JI62_9GAMM|nr:MULTISPECIES: 23S rRNA (adenine(1618)-N(6))-methyltransferase RlmF [Yersiniaceae]MBS0969647.1 23S rRNA (adenine(1618)-N(6))-methyltransferase RlmF [Nissabacter archeti]MDV5142441.1 23S rRNA (adenine(1618)-N(6))-methyltransferase RlmF [Chimaeribacter arupi]PLR35329.1 23S rRNA (adenine(1618)-N(6))-methyltransferase RlmF [Chimaeribacter arupi]PLR43344.1 23S rRNA (adenine(1618)-N(6))-methyltransferase RlmF [Chimaeribacter arupi]
MQKKKTFPQEKSGLHARNRHRSRYDFPALIASSPELAAFVAENAWGDLSVDFADPAAVKALNRALLRHFYQIAEWDIPEGYLCPPIPGRADYLHHLADLLASCNRGEVPRGKNITVLDVGIGANCIYPIIGLHDYGWRFTGSDTDEVALASAKKIIAQNPLLTHNVRLRLQKQPQQIFTNIIKPNERYDATLCNPPFHASAEEAASGTRRKRQNLGQGNPDGAPLLNFGGQSNELWCEGGEALFISRMVSESRTLAQNCFWFTSLVSKKETLPLIYQALEEAGAVTVRTLDMAQGQKVSRIVAWTFLNERQQAAWVASRWQG